MRTHNKPTSTKESMWAYDHSDALELVAASSTCCNKMNPPHTKDADSLDFEVAARPRLMKFQKNWNSKKIHIKFQIVGMLAKGIYSKYIICNLNTDILVVFLIPKK